VRNKGRVAESGKQQFNPWTDILMVTQLRPLDHAAESHTTAHGPRGPTFHNPYHSQPLCQGLTAACHCSPSPRGKMCRESTCTYDGKHAYPTFIKRDLI
jgi:hypothetical protein